MSAVAVSVGSVVGDEGVAWRVAACDGWDTPGGEPSTGVDAGAGASDEVEGVRTGKCQRLPIRLPEEIKMLSRNTDTDDAPNNTVHPASMMGARPPSDCCRPGTRCAGTVSVFVSWVVPDEVA